MGIELHPKSLSHAEQNRYPPLRKSLYRKLANTACSCAELAHSRFRYISKTSGESGRFHMIDQGVIHFLAAHSLLRR